MRYSPRRVLLPIAALGVLLGCGGDTTTGPPAIVSTADRLALATAPSDTGTVGVALSRQPVLQIQDVSGQPFAKAGVSVSVTIDGTGSTLGTSTAPTDAAGRASFAGLGFTGVAGVHTVTFSATGLKPASRAMTLVAGTANHMAVSAGQAQSSSIGVTVPVPPAIRLTDDGGNPVAGVTVTFAVGTGGGTITGPTAVSGADGVATIGSWTLGPSPGANTLTATAAGAAESPLTFTATGTPLAPAAVATQAGDLQTAVVGSVLPVAPSVKVTAGNGQAMAGIPVTFAVTGGGGAASGTSVVTDAAGIATVGSWTLGTAAGANTLSATVTGIAPATVTATATAGPATQIVLARGDGQTATINHAVTTDPGVTLRDQYGNVVVSGPTVAFSVTGGGGRILSSATDGQGVQSARWQVGSIPGPNALQAQLPGGGGSTVTFSATATGGPSAFKIDVRFTSSVTPAQQAAFTAAAARWTTMITGDVPDVLVNSLANSCHPDMNETVDDVVIYVTIGTIDGAGGVLGQAGPCIIRNASNIPAVGTMQFDVVDLAQIEADGELTDVITHEMGHVLGFGIVWDDDGLIVGAGGADPFFTGWVAVQAFNTLGGAAYYAGTPVPVENTGGSGTADAHWREAVMQSELMTGFIHAAGNPLSAVTVGSMQDLGYTVDISSADPYVFGAGLRAGAAPARPPLRLVEAMLPWPVTVVNARGDVIGYRKR